MAIIAIGEGRVSITRATLHRARLSIRPRIGVKSPTALGFTFGAPFAFATFALIAALAIFAFLATFAK